MLNTDVVDCRVLGIVGADTNSKLYVVGGMKLVQIQLPLSTPEEQIDVKEEQFHVVEEHDYARSSKKKAVQSLDCSKSSRARKKRSRMKKEPEKFACSMCNVNFERHGDYKRHMVKHSDQRPYKCEVCEKAFKRPAEMSCHMDLHRGVEYLCELCNFTTINKVSLSTHKRRMHKRDFRYHCDKCNRSFMSNYDLQDHKASHLGTKTFICEHCGNAYSQRTYLVAHKRFVHRIQQGAPKKFHCNLCSKSFATDHNLRKHISLHSQTFLCAHCGKEFATKHDLKLHTRKHTGERPYQCKVCSKAFARSVTLRVHSLTHTGERPYVCDICEQSFTQRSSMMAHRRKHPGDHPRPPPLLLSKLDSNEHSS